MGGERGKETARRAVDDRRLCRVNEEVMGSKEIIT